MLPDLYFQTGAFYSLATHKVKVSVLAPMLSIKLELFTFLRDGTITVASFEVPPATMSYKTIYTINVSTNVSVFDLTFSVFLINWCIFNQTIY